MNVVALTGELKNIGEIKQKPDGTPLIRFEVGVMNKSESIPDFVDCVVYGRTAERMQEWERGIKISVKGRLHLQSDINTDGTRRKSAEVIAEAVELIK